MGGEVGSPHTFGGRTELLKTTHYENPLSLMKLSSCSSRLMVGPLTQWACQSPLHRHKASSQIQTKSAHCPVKVARYQLIAVR